MIMKNANFKKVFEKYGTEVHELLLDYLPASHQIAEVDTLYKMMREYPSRKGKMIRPVLCMLTAEAFGEDYKKALVSAAGLELFQNWILIHDDIEDNSSIRRSKPTLNKKYGDILALNAGDGLSIKTLELLLKNRDVLGYEKTGKILFEYADCANTTVEGQHMELSWIKNKKWDITEEDYFSLAKRKTAKYTAITPMVMGSIIAGYDEEYSGILAKVGEDAGVAFQIQDDVLNLMDNGSYEKDLYGDISEGKRTLILVNTLKNSKPKEREKFIQIMDKEKKENKYTEFVMKLIEKTDSISYASERAELLADRAKTNLSKIRFNNSLAREHVKDTIDYMIYRNK